MNLWTVYPHSKSYKKNEDNKSEIPDDTVVNSFGLIPMEFDMHDEIVRHMEHVLIHRHIIEP